MELLAGRRPTLLLVLLSAAVISSLIAASAAESANVEYCNKKANYPVKVKKIDITPYPIPRGEEVTFSINAVAELPAGVFHRMGIKMELPGDILAASAGMTLQVAGLGSFTYCSYYKAGGVIPKGKLVIDVSYWIFHVHEETDDLCTKTLCPVSTGDFVISHKQTLPGITPPGSYTLTMKLLGEKNEQLTCVTFGFSIGFVSSVADS